MSSPTKHRDMRCLLNNWFADSCSPRTLYRLIEREDDPFPSPIKIGGKNFWRDDIVEEWFERQGTSQAADDPPLPEADTEAAPAAPARVTA